MKKYRVCFTELQRAYYEVKAKSRKAALEKVQLGNLSQREGETYEHNTGCMFPIDYEVIELK